MAFLKRFRLRSRKPRSSVGQPEGKVMPPTSLLTEGVPGDDAVLHLPAGSRVAIVGQEGPDAWAGLPFRDVEGTLVGPREGGTVVVDVVEVHQHLRSGRVGGGQ